MFTGIITDVGRVRSVEQRGDTRIVIQTVFDPETIDMGASIACNGICLTVVDKGTADEGNWFAVDASKETLDCTNMGPVAGGNDIAWTVGTKINLERALKVGDELGGHIVSGHVDGIATISAIEPDGDSLRYTFNLDADLNRFMAPKGSATINGVSLTVNNVTGDGFDVNIIPHTQQETTFGDAKTGDRVNIEIDVLARYVARLTNVL